MELDLFLTVVLPATVIVLAVGFAIILFFNDRENQLTLLELIAGMVAFAVITSLFVIPVGTGMAMDDMLSFNEHWNGSLVGYSIQEVTCTRDGLCQHEYDCDPYEVCHDVCVSRDDDGDCTRWDEQCTTHYHSCPYCTKEYHYRVHTNVEFPGSPFGPVTLASYRLPDNPHDNRWESWRGVRLPEHVISRAGVGPTSEWLDYAQRIDRGDLPNWTGVATYENYIYASEQSILRERSTYIEQLLAANLMPPPPVNRSLPRFDADKVSVVGNVPGLNEQVWQEAVFRYNSALGPERRGDLSLLIVSDEALRQVGIEPLTYVSAVRAYWQDQERNGDNLFSKNGILVVVGTSNGLTVSWMRATTGMPIGNETLINSVEREVRHMVDAQQPLALTPEAVLGNVRVIAAANPNPPADYTAPYAYRAEPQIEYGDGFLETMIFGLENPDTAFERVSMSADDEGDVGAGFRQLQADLRLKDYHKRGMTVAATMVGLFLLVFAYFFKPSR